MAASEGDPRSVRRGRKPGTSVSGAPFPLANDQDDGPDRPTRHVPSAPEAGTAEAEEVSPPTAVEEDDDGQ